MTWLSYIFCICSGVSLAALWTAYLCIARHLRRRTPAAASFPVSILKPLKGVESGLRDNLRAIAAQQHEQFEIIFGAEDPLDPALAVAREVQAEFSHVPIQVIFGSIGTGLNPKVRLLRQLSQHARHDWLLISDSNVRPDPLYLSAMQGRQREQQADLVHSVLVGVQGRSFGGRLEELQLNGWVAASICFSDTFGHSCVIGKSMLLRRSALAEVGGLADVADILAEDYILGSRLEAAGKKVALSAHRLPVMTGESPLGHFFNRHVRWGQMRRRIAPGFFVAELAANPTPFLLALAASAEGSLRLWALGLQTLKWATDAFVYRRLALAPAAKTLLLMPLKDLLVPVMWGISLMKRTVNWRGHVMWVGPGSRLYPSLELARAAEGAPTRVTSSGFESAPVAPTSENWSHF